MNTLEFYSIILLLQTNCSVCSYILYKNKHIIVLYTHLQHHNDTIIKTDAMTKTQEDFFNNILPLTLLQGFERVVQGLHVRGSWRSNINCNILTPLL